MIRFVLRAGLVFGFLALAALVDQSPGAEMPRFSPEFSVATRVVDHIPNPLPPPECQTECKLKRGLAALVEEQQRCNKEARSQKGPRFDW